MLYRSNKVMYDRSTNSLWHQFTGEPILGPLVGVVKRQPFFPSIVTTWGEWTEEHPDTTILSLETGVYPPNAYPPESDPRATYNDYFTDPTTRFPVPFRDETLVTKSVIVGVVIEGEQKAYPVAELRKERVVNDTVGGQDLVVVASSISEAARVFDRGGHTFALPASQGDAEGIPTEVVDELGNTWTVTQEALVDADDPGQRLGPVPYQTSFLFGWFAFYPDTEVYEPGG